MGATQVVVIGGGVAGYPAALRAARLGAEVTLVEKDKIGGVCLNKGCIPTKVFLHTASIFKDFKRAPIFGISAQNVEIDFNGLITRKKAVVERLTKGVDSLLKNKKVKVIHGTASFIDSKKVRIQETEEVLSGDKFILAMGSTPSQLSIPGSEKVPLLTSDDLLEIKSLPQSLIIIGGGYIGVEFGQFFNRMGTKVAIIEMMDQLIPTEDQEISQGLRNVLEKEGINIFTEARVQKIKEEELEKTVVFSTPTGEKELKSEMIAQTVGRKPYTEGMGLEKIGLGVEKGRIVVNEKMETNIPHIYAAGDVIGGIMLAHVAMAEGEGAARNALGIPSSISNSAVPRCIYTSPEVACVGLTEKQALKKGEVQVSRFPFRAVGKATLMEETEGMVKIVAGKKYGEILGVHIIGPHATDLIAEAVLAIEMEVTVEELAHTIHPHPTLSEGLGEAAMLLSGGAMHLP
ncbi:MAG: dihydrolipoyl dehydrogenase [Deltaproteobacteria bacterium]|nr:dihydrolipoyl dehydrogenase [Deltaproteobacteria bacterium]